MKVPPHPILARGAVHAVGVPVAAELWEHADKRSAPITRAGVRRIADYTMGSVRRR